MTDKPAFGTILLTGAAGKLGSVLREPLAALCSTLRLSDLRPLTQACSAKEEFIACDLAQTAEVQALMQGVELLVHFGGVAHEQAFERIAAANLIGLYNLYDAALTHGVRRVVFASSNHVNGFSRIDEATTPASPPRPDSLYGVSKVYGEALARYYFDRHGIETVCLRIGSCLPEPKSPRCLQAWLSHRDLIELVRCAATAPQAGFAVVWGISDNQQACWQGDDAERIGYQPQDCAEPWREQVERARPEMLSDPRMRFQGGSIVSRDYRKPATLFPHPAPALPAWDDSKD
ncbi:NAD(P)-dependent oxidoreductase [Uliginosibacterium sediminicola]|uniref:NAD(P)-dependent oxidoreductase n=1 Tax=Uliginosibacterium sediminicola TaxID=2024550 RepID=A0ABU9YT99_9RHOO